MDLPATQAIDDEDLLPTQQFAADDAEREPTLVGKLLINSNDEQHSIFSGTTIIGRQPGCTIVLNDETVSKRHAEIEAESSDKAVFIKDLRSSNKTKINDTKLRPEASYQIKDNDKLTFGKITATFKIHRAIDDSLVAGTPQVNRNRAVIPDTPDTSMNNSSTAEGDVSTIPGTQADENDSCFRRPQIPVRTSISNEHESPKHVPFMLDDVPSPLANSKDNKNKKESDISEVETQRFTVNNTKEITDNSIHTVETQKVVIHEKSSVNSHDNGGERKLNNSSVKKVLSDKFENQPLEDMATQTFACAKFDSSFRKSENTSIYSAETQKVLPDTIENQSLENMETQAYVPATSDDDKSNPADVSIHSAATQRIESTVPANDLIENLDTQSFKCNSLSSTKRKSANTSIYSAETQKLVAYVSNEALDNIETQKFVSISDSSKEKSADVSIYSAATQKIESTSENRAIENLDTQKFDKRDSHQEGMVSSLSFSIQDIDTMPFTKHELSLGEKSNNVELQSSDDSLLNSAPLDEKSSNAERHNDNDVLLDSTPKVSKSDSDNKVLDFENENDNEKSDSKIDQSLPTSSDKLDKSKTGDEAMHNKKQINETLSKSSTDSDQTSNKLDKSKSLMESDDEEEIFSQNLIENSPFALLLDDSKNDSKEQSNIGLQKDVEHENEKTIDSGCTASSNKADSSIDNKNLINNKSTVASNEDSETDEEGAFSNHLSEESENKKLHEKTGNDSETDEEGVFSSHASEEKGEKSNSKVNESDSETDEEGVFSGRLSQNSKGLKNSCSKIIQESESEDEGVSANSSKTETTKNPIAQDENNAKTVYEMPSANESTKKHSLNKLTEIVQRESPAPESDDDIFNEIYEENRTSSSNLNKTNDPIVDKDDLESMQKSPIADTVNSKSGENDNNDDDDMAPTKIVETDISLAPTQIVNTRRMSMSEKEDGPKEVDELAPTQLMETQTLPVNTENAHSTPARKQSKVTDSAKDGPKECDDMDLAPTQKLVETQECVDTLAPTQKVVDTQLCSEEMGALQFTESFGPTQVIENESNAVGNEVPASPKISPSTSKRQLEEVEITSNKKQKTADVSQRVVVDLNSTVEQNLNEMFEGPEEKLANSEPPMETQRLENILETSQIEEDAATALNASISQPSPTLSNKRSNIKEKNRRKPLMLNKSASQNANDRSVVNLNDTIEKNLNDLFDNTVGSAELPEPEPMLTQQLENALNSSQDSNPTENKEEEGRRLTVSRRKSRLSLSMNLNSSMQKTRQEKEKRSSNAPVAKVIETTPQSSSNEKSPQKEDYAANLEDKKDDAISETPTKNDKDIVYRRGTIGFTDDLKPVSRDSKTATTTSKTSGATINRTKRIIDSEDDDSESTREPSAKRTKTLVDRQKLHQKVTPDAALVETNTARTPKASGGHVAKAARTDSSELSAVESSIVEDKNEGKKKPNPRGRPMARNKKATVDTSSERSANSSKENVEESDVQKSKTRGRAGRIQATDSSVLDKASSQNEVPASDVENKSTRSTRGRLVRPNQAKKEEAKVTKKQSQEIKGSDAEEPEKPKMIARKNTRKATKQESKTVEDSDSEVAEESKTVARKNTRKATKQESKTIEDSDSEVAEEPKTVARKNTRKATKQESETVEDSDSEVEEEPKTAVKKSTRGRLAKTNDKTASGSKVVADSKNDKSQDEGSETQSSSQSESVAARSRTRKNKGIQESDSGSSETPEATTTITTTRGSRKRLANDKPDLIVKVTEVDSKTETETRSDETKDDQSQYEVNVFRTMKKKMNLKPEEPTKAPARKTRTRATKNAVAVAESSSEESQEVADIMKNNIVEDSKNTTTRRRGRAIKSNLSYAENTESSDDVFEKPTARPKRARLAKASQSSQASDTDEDSKSTQSSQKSTRRKHSPSLTPPADAVLTPSRTSRLSLSPSKRPKVLFTGEKSDAHRNILTKLGGVETDEFNSCSVLITDKVRRTFKFLCSLARGIPIASIKWLDESKKANRFLDLEEHILNDPEAEDKFKFNLKESLNGARKHKLLEGYTVLLAPKIKQPPIAELKEMVLSSGGKPLVRAPAKWPEKCVVITTEQELDSAKKLITKAPKSVTVHSVEFILTGILRQEVNFNEFKLLG